MQNPIFTSKETRGKLTAFSHTVTSNVSSEKISSTTSIKMEVTSAKAKLWRKNINYLNEYSFE